MPPRNRECEHCGYDLSGFVEGEREPICPECGARFHPADAWTRQPCPPWWNMTCRLIGAASLFSAALALMMLWEMGFAILAMGASVFLFAWVGVAVAVPIWQARELASRATIMPVRRRSAWLLAIGGIIGSVGVSGVLLWLGWRWGSPW